MMFWDSTHFQFYVADNTIDNWFTQFIVNVLILIKTRKKYISGNMLLYVIFLAIKKRIPLSQEPEGLYLFFVIHNIHLCIVDVCLIIQGVSEKKCNLGISQEIHFFVSIKDFGPWEFKITSNSIPRA